MADTPMIGAADALDGSIYPTSYLAVYPGIPGGGISDTATSPLSFIAQSVDNLSSYGATYGAAYPGISDAAFGAFARGRGVSDAITTSDNATRIATHTRNGGDFTAVRDVSTRAITRARVAIESIIASDAATKVATRTRATSEYVTIGDSTTVSITESRAAADVVTVSSAISRTVTGARTISGAILISDVVNRASFRARTVVESVSAIDVAIRIAVRGRTAAEGFTNSDIVSRVVPRVRATADSANVSDTNAKLFTASRFFSDSLTIVDSSTKLTTSARSAIENMSVADLAAGIFASGAISYTRDAVDSISASDTISRIGSHARAGTDVVTISDKASRAATARTRSTTDGIGLSDFITRFKTGARAVTDAILFSDATTRGRITARVAVDSLSISTTLARLVSLARAASEFIATVADSTIRPVIARSRSASDSASVIDTADGPGTINKFIGESITIIDAAARILQRGRAAFESLDVTFDAAERVFEITRAVQEDLAVVDSAIQVPHSYVAADIIDIFDGIISHQSWGCFAYDEVVVTDFKPYFPVTVNISIVSNNAKHVLRSYALTLSADSTRYNLTKIPAVLTANLVEDHVNLDNAFQHKIVRTIKKTAKGEIAPSQIIYNNGLLSTDEPEDFEAESYEALIYR